jgi:hypothetical protein
VADRLFGEWVTPPSRIVNVADGRRGRAHSTCRGSRSAHPSTPLSRCSQPAADNAWVGGDSSSTISSARAWEGDGKKGEGWVELTPLPMVRVCACRVSVYPIFYVYYLFLYMYASTSIFIASICLNLHYICAPRRMLTCGRVGACVSCCVGPSNSSRSAGNPLTTPHAPHAHTHTHTHTHTRTHTHTHTRAHTHTRTHTRTHSHTPHLTRHRCSSAT